MTAVERRLHQLMLSLGDFEGGGGGGRRASVYIDSCEERGYSIVTVECVDRPRLMFDTVCTLMDMHCVIFHASVDSRDGFAFQGYRLELKSENRVGLLSDITRVLRKNGLVVVRADIATEGGKAVNAFYLRDTSGNNDVVGMEFILDSMKKEMGQVDLAIRRDDINYAAAAATTSSIKPPEKSRFSIGHLLRNQIERFSHTFITIN